jgi:DNA-binding NarL/FixJ family response regulator
VIRVHVAHDNPLLRDTLAAALSHEADLWVKEASPEGREGLARVDDAKIDVLVLAVPPHEDAAGEVARYRRLTPTTRIVGVYSHPKVRDGMAAAGADAVVDEYAGLGPLLEAIRRVAPLEG